MRGYLRVPALALTIALAAALVGPAQAQSFPTRPVRLVVPLADTPGPAMPPELPWLRPDSNTRIGPAAVGTIDTCWPSTFTAPRTSIALLRRHPDID